ncbi:MAG: prepilin-type N-terminal cleavage/methylation domain-containing protein [Rickettsiales bacterium]|nr:prepilin-type N-terminal cleavage/methylation domain-containing protein [Rickettsiales bacterium]
MLPAKQKQKRPSRKQEGGFTLVEAMVATMISGIAFAGVFSLTMLSTHHMEESVSRQKLQLMAEQMLEVIESDLENVDNYAMSFATCNAPGAGETALSDTRRYEWCQRLNGEVGAPAAAETRTITITTLADQRKVVHILLEAENDGVQVVIKRAYDG